MRASVRRPRAFATFLAALAAAAALELSGCGKKGPPLPPLPGSTPRVTDLACRQVGDEVHATFTLPVRPHESEIDYATNGIELWRRSNDVPAGPAGAASPGGPSNPLLGARSLPTAQAPAVVPVPAGILGGGNIPVVPPTDNGPTPGQFEDGAVMVATLSGDSLFDALKAPEMEMVDHLTAPPDKKYYWYAVVLKTSMRKKGTVSNIATLEPQPTPPMPVELSIDMKEGRIVLAWKAPAMPLPAPPEAPSGATGSAVSPAGASGPVAPLAGTTGPAAAGATATEPPPTGKHHRGGRGESAAQPEGPTGGSGPTAPALPEQPASVGYNVYRAEGDAPMPSRPVNSKPLTDTGYEDTDVEIGTTYSYVVRTIVERGDLAVESAPTSPVSRTYADVFAPKTPEGLRLIAEGSRAVNLIWNPNGEADLAGYGVYRREPGGAWARLDTGSAQTAVHRDESVQPGKTYEYAVSAYDTASPPNESAKCDPQSVTIPGGS